MLTIGASIEERTRSLTCNSESDRLKRNILHFWRRHPYAKFSGDCIYYAIGNSKSEIIESLQDFVVAGVLDVTNEHKTDFYSLTTDDDKRSLVQAFAFQT